MVETFVSTASSKSPVSQSRSERLVGVLDCGDLEKTKRRTALYTGYGFLPLASNPRRMLQLGQSSNSFDRDGGHRI
ncbi:hypothetical protein ATY79_02575 [Rhizobium sp. R693]|nr:hypothetical protein ATY79_02575 [Rhizobium sp. R693]